MSAPPHPAILLAGSVAFFLPRKCAFNSIKHALREHFGDALRYLDPGEALDVPIRVVAIRDPIGRLVSCWRDKVVQHWMSSLEANGIKKGMSWPEFVDLVCVTSDLKANPHFRSYHHELPEDPEHVLRVEHLADDWEAMEACLGWPSKGVRHYNSTNATPPVEITPEQAAAIGRRYQFDVLMYERLCGLTAVKL